MQPRAETRQVSEHGEANELWGEGAYGVNGGSLERLVLVPVSLGARSEAQAGRLDTGAPRVRASTVGSGRHPLCPRLANPLSLLLVGGWAKDPRAFLLPTP